MYFIASPFHDPAYNIALEEYLLRETENEFFMLYVDAPSIIVGKHQNTLAEINYKFVIENNISVIRRISGGGTVFHDFGNLNFCFIANSREGNQIDFKKYTAPIIHVLQQDYNIPAVLAGKNDIRVDDLKVSGNAEHVFKNRVLHHGTLLVNSNLEQLSEGLRIVPDRYFDKAVKSIRSKVANLSGFNPDIKMEDLKDRITWYLFRDSGIKNYILSENEHQLISEKVKSKFGTWEWNYAYSPAYRFETDEVKLVVENGFIKEVNFFVFPELEKELVGKKHCYDDLINSVQAIWRLF